MPLSLHVNRLKATTTKRCSSHRFFVHLSKARSASFQPQFDSLSPRTTAARTIVQREGTPSPAPAEVRQYHRSGGTAEPLPLAALVLDSHPLLRCPRMVER
ncbi:MAG: hypothetical protein F9K27_07680 [Anaerolineae bacterium]|nr:MAG: hypothetical protein F9K27_07680 [Anaerolineae bacterium]